MVEGQVTRVVVDAGGTRTRCLVARPDGSRKDFELSSINPSARGESASRVLRDLLVRIRELVAGWPAVGWLASAAVDPQHGAAEQERVRGLARVAGLRIPLVLSNDIVPLLWGVPALAGRGIVVVCGTGSAYFGGDGAGNTVRVGGCEYLASDEGSAFDLGRAGLQAAARALDGRGPQTSLVEAVEACGGLPVPELARSLAAEPYPKQRVASLAHAVCASWLVGDQVAAEIVRARIDELVAGVRAVRTRLQLQTTFAVATTGGVFSGCPEYHEELARRLELEPGVSSVEHVTDTVAAVLDALIRLLGAGSKAELPPGMAGRDAWLVDWTEGAGP